MSNQEAPLFLETEKHPKVLVTFCGVSHHPLNLEIIPQVRDELLRHIDSNSGKTIVFLEHSSATQSFNEKVLRNIKYYGGIANLEIATNLIVRDSGVPSQSAIQAARDLINSGDVDSLIKSGVVPIDNLHGTYLKVVLDNISQNYDVNFMFETVSKGVSVGVLELTKAYEEVQAHCTNNWRNGSFDGIIEGWKQYCRMDQRVRMIRDRETVAFLKTMVKKMVKVDGGSIFMIFGAVHSSMVHDLQRKLGPKSQTEFVVVDTSQERLLPKILRCLDRNEIVLDELYAQEFFSRMAAQKLFDYMQGERKVGLFANNYELISTCVERVASCYSVDEIAQICERRVDLQSFVLEHPLADSLRNLLQEKR